MPVNAKSILSGRAALVTGAPSGIGRELAAVLASRGCDLALAAHTSEKEKVHAYARELSGRHKIRVEEFICDLAEPDAPLKLHKAVCAQFKEVDILVNCAGLFAYGPFLDTPMEKAVVMLRVNAEAMMKLAWLFGNDMRSRKRGWMLTVSSVAGFQPVPGVAAYAATKAYIQSLTEALREELAGTGVVVTSLNPPFTRTPLLKDLPGTWWTRVIPMAEAAFVARAGVDALERGKAVCITDRRSAFFHTFLPRISPRVLTVKFAAKMLAPRGKEK
jgi:short-subunit dehydrogenase